MKKFNVMLFLFALLFAFVSVARAEEKVAEKAVELETLVVTGTKTEHKIEDVPVETILITSEEIEKSNAKNISELLKYVPGFNMSQQSDLMSGMGYKNTVRGLNIETRYLLVLVDGQRVFTGFRSGGMAGAGFAHNINMVPVELIDHIEIVKGPGSALYGSDAMVGVLNIITKRPPEETMAEAGASYGTYEVKGQDYLGNKPEDTDRDRYEAHAIVGGRISDRIGAIFNFSYEENDGIHPTKYDVNRTYLHARMDADVTDNLRLRLGGEYATWEEKEKDTGDDKDEDAPRVYGIIDYQISPFHRIKLQGYYQNMDCDFKDPLYGDQKADVTYTDYELQYTGEIFKDNFLSLGFEYLEEELDTNFVKGKKITTKSVYIQDEWGFFDNRLIMVPGVRYDDNDAYGDEVNPKFSAMFKFTPDTILRGSVGRSFKCPMALHAFSEPINHVVVWIFSNPDLKPEKSVTYQVGAEQWLWNRRVMVAATYFHMDVEDMIDSDMTGEMYMGAPVMTWKNIKEAEIQGVESMIGINIMEGLNLDLNYTYTDTEDKETGERLVDTPEHSFGARLDYANKRYCFGGAVSLAYTSEQENMWFGPGTSEQMDSFTTVGLNLWKDLFDHGRLTFQVDNLFDEDMEGSNMIYVGQTFTGKLEIIF